MPLLLVGFAHGDHRFHYAPDDQEERNQHVEYVWKDEYEDAEDYGEKGECESGYVERFLKSCSEIHILSRCA